MTDDPSLARIISQAIAKARDAGSDYRGQAQQAVEALLAVRPDMTATEAMALVERLRD